MARNSAECIRHGDIFVLGVRAVAQLVAAEAAEKKNPLLAIADTGVNYLLPEIQPHIARTANGNLLGYDFWDMDDMGHCRNTN